MKGRWKLAALGAAFSIAGLAWFGTRAPEAAANVPQQQASAGAAFFAPVGANGLVALPQPRAQRLQQLRAQVAQTRFTFCSYRDGTRYPNTSRPVSEHPDQVYPNNPVTESHAMRLNGGGTDSGITIQSAQTRVFMASGESASFSLRALDTNGAPLPLVVRSAVAKGLVFGGAREAASVVLPFADGAEGVHTGTLAPAQSGLAGFSGTIRTVVGFSVGGKEGSVAFDVVYSPELPATWAGPVREAMEDGSLVFYLKANMRTAGRYLVSGRLDDAKGQPFALVSFNELLPAGPNEIKLSAFGRLLTDAKPALPLTLRDVDGYLLKENTDPDRALMPRLEGRVFASKVRSLAGASDAEWQSEERSRYLAEYGKDLQQARAELARLDPGQPVEEGCRLQ